MGLLVRPVLARAAVAYDEAGRVPGTWITVIFAGVLISVGDRTDTIGIAVIFGAFVMGVVMPRHAGSQRRRHAPRRGLRADAAAAAVLRLHGPAHERRAARPPELILVTLALIAIAIVGKYGGTLIAARVIRLPWRESAVLGALMNTRGLTELIVLNLALSIGVISSALFTALVMMALVTTIMAGPIMRLLDPHNTFGEAPETQLEVAPRARRPSTAPGAPRALDPRRAADRRGARAAAGAGQAARDSCPRGTS